MNYSVAIPIFNEEKNLPITINSLKDQGISYYRTEVKIFCQTQSLIPNKKKFIVLDDISLKEETLANLKNNLGIQEENIHRW